MLGAYKSILSFPHYFYFNRLVSLGTWPEVLFVVEAVQSLKLIINKSTQNFFVIMNWPVLEVGIPTTIEQKCSFAWSSRAFSDI